MCGLFGFIGTNVSPSAIHILGTMNEARGTDSWGLHIRTEEDSKIFKEIGAYSKMSSVPKLPTKKQLCTIIGHTRAKTVGANNAKNAHPFDLGNGWVGAKNGTAHNWKEICKGIGIETKDIDVDSEGLMKAVTEGFPSNASNVLSTYTGGAAITMTNTPGEVWLYRGGTKENWGVNKGKIIGERPLFILQTKTGIYWSSLDYSLSFLCRTLGFDEENIESYYINSLVRIGWDGTESDAIDVDRSKLRPGHITSGGNMNSHAIVNNGYASNRHQTNFQNTRNISLSGKEIVKKDEIIPEDFVGKIYWHAGYFRREGIEANGKYIVNEDNGEYTVSMTDNADVCYFFKGIYVTAEGYRLLTTLFSGVTTSGKLSGKFAKKIIEVASRECLFPFSEGVLIRDSSKVENFRSSDKDGYPNEVETVPFGRKVELSFAGLGKLTSIDDFSIYNEEFFKEANLSGIQKVPQSVWDVIDAVDCISWVGPNTNYGVYDHVWNKVGDRYKEEFENAQDANFGSNQTDEGSEQMLIGNQMSDDALEKHVEVLIDEVTMFSNDNLVGATYDDTTYKNRIAGVTEQFLKDLENAREHARAF